MTVGRRLRERPDNAELTSRAGKPLASVLFLTWPKWNPVQQWPLHGWSWGPGLCAQEPNPLSLGHQGIQ
jgi:hypothetical protein